MVVTQEKINQVCERIVAAMERGDLQCEELLRMALSQMVLIQFRKNISPTRQARDMPRDARNQFLEVVLGDSPHN
jgi:hypothetical protein